MANVCCEVCSNAALPPWLPDPVGERELGKIAETRFTIPDTQPLLSPSGFLLEFPWNFYRFRDILTPNVSRKDLFMPVPVDEVD